MIARVVPETALGLLPATTMPAFDALGAAKLRQAADYMLELGSKAREGTRTISNADVAR